MGPGFLKLAVLFFGISQLAVASSAALRDPSARFAYKDSKGTETRIELRCVSEATATLQGEAYYCEIVRTLGGVQMSAHAIYPKQLQNILARYWMEKGEASGSYQSPEPASELSWEWNFSDRAMKGKEHFASQSISSSESRAALWLFKALQSWSNFRS